MKTYPSGDPLVCDIPVGTERDAFIRAAISEGLGKPSQLAGHAMLALDRFCQMHPGWSFTLDFNAAWSVPHKVLLHRPTVGHDYGSGPNRAEAASAALVLAIRAIARGDAA